MSDKTKGVVLAIGVTMIAVAAIVLSWLICAGLIMLAGWLIGVDVSLKMATGCYIALMVVRMIFRRKVNINIK